MTVTVPGGGDGGGRVPLLVITTFVASTARGAGRSLFRESLALENCNTRFPRLARNILSFFFSLFFYDASMTLSKLITRALRESRADLIT